MYVTYLWSNRAIAIIFEVVRLNSVAMAIIRCRHMGRVIKHDHHGGREVWRYGSFQSQAFQDHIWSIFMARTGQPEPFSFSVRISRGCDLASLVCTRSFYVKVQRMFIFPQVRLGNAKCMLRKKEVWKTRKRWFTATFTSILKNKCLPTAIHSHLCKEQLWWPEK